MSVDLEKISGNLANVENDLLRKQRDVMQHSIDNPEDDENEYEDDEYEDDEDDDDGEE